MAWYAYCIVEQSSFSPYKARRMFPLHGLTGIDGAQVFALPSGDFAVIVSEFLPSTSMEGRTPVEHSNVIKQCFRRGTVLPFRFGSIFETEEGLRQSLRLNRKTFHASVAQLRGKAEMRLRVTLSDVAKTEMSQPTGIGNAYLLSLQRKASVDRERQNRARSVSVQVHKLFNPLQEEVSCKKTDNSLRLDIAHLIDNGSVEKYQHRLTSAQRVLPNCQVTLSGPWPPYHFMPGRVRTVCEN
jgi:Gas vesicle synthesis protein GvpL/GvpF